MSPKLIETAADGAREREILISGEEFLIGRGADCNLRLTSSAISRHHCLLRFKGKEATLSDLGSSNGTFVNGKRVRGHMTLHTGDEIRIGDSHFVVHLGDGFDLTKPAGDPAASTCKLSAADAGNIAPVKPKNLG